MNVTVLLAAALLACTLGAMFWHVRREARRAGMLYGAALLAEYARYLRQFQGDPEAAGCVLDAHTLVLDAYFLDLDDARRRKQLHQTAPASLRSFLSTR